MIEEAFESAAAYGRARSADPAYPTTLRWETLQPVLRSERPLFVQANELPQIRHALTLAERHGFDLVIVGGADAWRLAGVLRVRQVVVVIAAVHRLPLRRDEAWDAGKRLDVQMGPAASFRHVGPLGIGGRCSAAPARPNITSTFNPSKPSSARVG